MSLICAITFIIIIFISKMLYYNIYILQSRAKNQQLKSIAMKVRRMEMKMERKKRRKRMKKMKN